MTKFIPASMLLLFLFLFIPYSCKKEVLKDYDRNTTSNRDSSIKKSHHNRAKINRGRKIF